MKNAVIIGAGPAGLTAALELLRRSKEYRVTVLEADNATGGISRTVEINGSRMDIGGHRFYTKSDRVLDFWKSLMPLQGAPAADELETGSQAHITEGGADPEKIDRVLLSRRRVSRIYRKNRFYDYPVSLKTLLTMGAEAIPAGFSYMAASLKKRKEESLEDFYINRFGKRLYSIFFESYTEKVWGVHPSKLPPDWGAQRVRGLSAGRVLRNMLGFVKTEEKSLIKRFLYPKFGPGQMWQCAADEIIEKGGKIIFGARAEKLTVEKDRITAVTASGVTYPADVVISSMPLSELINALGCEVPKKVLGYAQNLHFRDFLTVGIEVGRLAVKNRTKYKTIGDIPPDCWIYVQEPEVKMGRLQIFNNWSPYMVSDPHKSVYIGTEYFCFEGDEIWNTGDEEMGAFAAEELEKMGIINRKDVKSFHCERMKKAYPSYDGGYSGIEEIRKYADKIENLYCVGRNGQHRYNNIDHSMITAMTAADIIINGGDKSDVWTVNPDGEYGE